MRSVEILGVRVDDVSMDEAVDRIAGYVNEPAGRPCRMIASVNPEFIMAARRRADFAAALSESDLNIPDGANLVRVARWLGRPLRERVAGSDLAPRLADRAAREGWKLFFLGGRNGVGQEAAARLVSQFQALQVAGTFEGSPDPAEEQAILDRVNASGATLLFVAYGAPAQDLWICRNRDRLTARAAIGVGGTLDFIAGRIPRAPLWMQKAGLEWLFRLAREPRRIRRQAVLVQFLWLALTARREAA
ncbi:MAG: WecB/TagA/CpsF family glycosyltransferase [Rudaea sp.]